MKPKTQQLTRAIQQAFVALDPETLLALFSRALQALYDDDSADWADQQFVALGWAWQDEHGRTYPEPPDDETDVEWQDPDPEQLSNRIAQMDVSTVYHTVLPIFYDWPPLSAQGDQWMQDFAEWLAHPVLEPEENDESSRSDLSPRMTTADIAAGLPMSLGDCGDAWQLSVQGDALDVIDHRPYAFNARTPVGRSTDAPVLVLYPERGLVDWPALLAPVPLRSGKLFSGADIWVIYLLPEQVSRWPFEDNIALNEVKALAHQDAEAWGYWQKANADRAEE